MRLTCVLLSSVLNRNRFHIRDNIIILRKVCLRLNNFYHFKTMPFVASTKAPAATQLVAGGRQNIKKLHDASDSDEEIDGCHHDAAHSKASNARDVLHKNPSDQLLNKINNCASIQDIFTVFNSYASRFQHRHLAQTVFVLYDLKKIFQQQNIVSSPQPSSSRRDYFQSTLIEHETFRRILHLIEVQIDQFTTETLSYVLFYLSNLGLQRDSELFQLLLDKIKNDLLSSGNFSLKPASLFLQTVFNDGNIDLRNYFIVQDLVPLVFARIGSCESLDDLEDLTVCLNKLHRFVTASQLSDYVSTIKRFIDRGELNSDRYRIVLKVVLFLSYPMWREQFITVTAACILLLQGHLNRLNVSELIVLYEVFFKIQEPAAILNELQRYSLMHLQQLLDTDLSSEKIKLFSSIIYFSSPFSRMAFKNVLRKYFDDCTSLTHLILLRKILTYMKISDQELSQLYWDKVVEMLGDANSILQVATLCQEYVNFNTDIENYRHKGFERTVLAQLKSDITTNSWILIPKKLCSIMTFVLIYGDDREFLDLLVGKLEQHWEQLSHFDCLKLALALQLFTSTNNGQQQSTNIRKYLQFNYARRIDNVLTKVIKKQARTDRDLKKNNVLLKACIYKQDLSNSLVDDFLHNYKHFTSFSSKNMENISFSFLVTNSLIPEVVDKITDYIIQYKDNVLGFNIEKILSLCYRLGYYPKNSQIYFETAVNILIRDQNRLSGLSFVQSALALSFFNKLPESFIKSIFNTEFLDKLDTELANCYSKEHYPSRVRFKMMELNRAVCLCYPESGVPWFHQKYVEDLRQRGMNKREKLFNKRIKEYLLRIIGKSELILENVVTPYGYNIDFVINLDEERKIVPSKNIKCKTKLAILLIPQTAFTRIFVQLKGDYQLKKRHLEILGYQVILISFSDWMSFFHGDERTEFLTKLIWPKTSTE